MIRPTGKRVLLKRLDGDGREEQLASGVWKPARDESLRHGNAARVPMTFRAQVVAISELAVKATSDLLHVGDVVHCHTYEQTSTRTLTGDETPYGLLVDVDNILGIEADEPVDAVASTLSSVMKSPAARELFGTARADRIGAELENSPVLGMVEKTQDFKPSAVSALGFHRRQGGF